MEILRSEHPYRGRIVSVRVDEVRLDADHVARWEVVEHAESVTIVPILGDDTVILIEQYRHPAGKVILETPAGNVNPGESPAQAAQRELAEEIGYRAQALIPLGAFYLAPGWATEFMHVFLARGLVPADGQPDEDERIRRVELPWDEALRRLRAGELVDSKSIAALALAQAHVPR